MKVSRREFLRLLAEFSIAGTLTAILPVQIKPTRRPVRPPGAAVEDLFVASCLRCGRCLQACPTGAIVLARIEDGLISMGTPKIDPLRAPCEAVAGRCEDVLPCVRACPSDALGWVEDIKLGSTKLTRSKCIAWQRDGGCLVCKEVCPLLDAIDVVGKRPVFNENECVGCGRCVNACPSEPRAVELTTLKERRRTR